MKISLSTTKKIIIIITITLVVIASILLLVILPTIRDIQEINKEILFEKKGLETKFLSGQYYTKVYQDFKAIEPEINKIQGVYIKKGEELKFITDIENISDAHGLEQKITRLNAITDNDKKNLETLTLDIRLTGGFTQIMNFLSDLESLKYYFNIFNLSLFSTSDTKNQIKATILGRVYIIDEKYEAQVKN